ncbi:MAG TPA: DNRLRE domain-containing protein [Anaerolineales bacterium]|nr:DNRLRE domain-containing protein [Anaerolineales bacterium]
MGHYLFRHIRYFIAAVSIAGLVWLSLGPARLDDRSDVALAASDPMIAAAGDIACDPSNTKFNSGNGTSDACRQKATSDLLVNAGLAAVLPLGDNQYYCGGFQAFLQSYDLSWGRVKSITHPVVGNHEYLTAGGTDCNINNDGAAGHFNYFGSAAGDPGKGYYSYDVGTWHLIAINSNCGDAGGCSSSSPQGKWLAADLAAHKNYCTLAYWHIPLFSSGGRAASNTQSIWQVLYNNDVDIVLNGHDHIYERFAPQAPDGTLDTARGIREFIVGSGGANHTSLTAIIAANSEVRNADTYGILKLTLHPTSYDWQFVPEAGKTFTDSGTGNCHGANPPAVTPTRTGTVTRTPTATRTGAVTSTATSAQTGSTFTFAPTDDSYVYQTNATTNYGSAITLQADNGPVKNILLKFNVSGLSGQTVTSAKLRLYVTDPSDKGGDFYRVNDNTWQQGTVTWNNAPAATTLLGSLGSVSANNWYEVNVTSLITGNGTYSLRVSSVSSNGVDYSSKEGANPPQLVIQTQPVSTATFTPPATNTKTLTPTITSTPLAGSNLVLNAGFEIAGSSTAEAANWTEGTNHARASDKFHNGNWSLRSTYRGLGTDTFTTVPIAVSPNTTYTYSGYIWRTNSTGAACLDMADIPGELQLCTTISGSWQFLSGTWNSGSTTSVTLRLITDGSPTGDIWFDDISLIGPGSSTATSTNTNVPTPTKTAPPTATQTSSEIPPSPTDTATPTETPMETPVSTNTPTSIPTDTPEP